MSASPAGVFALTTNAGLPLATLLSNNTRAAAFGLTMCKAVAEEAATPMPTAPLTVWFAVNVFAAFSNGTLALNRASEIVPVRLAAGRLVKPPPLPANVPASVTPVPPFVITAPGNCASGIEPCLFYTYDAADDLPCVDL